MLQGTITHAQDLGPYKRQADRVLHFPINNEEAGFSGHVLAVMDGHTHAMFGETIPDICQKSIPQFFHMEQANAGYRSLVHLIKQLDKATWLDMHGSTLSMAIVLESHHHATCATLGDSPLFVITTDSVHIMPIHNVVTNIGERNTAIDRGGKYKDGWIWNFDTPPGVKPHGLEISRGLGDKIMGDVVSQEPSFYECRLDPKSAILITTDGVCDSMRSESFDEINDLLFQNVRLGGDANQIMETRKARMSFRDNASTLLWSTF